MLEKGPSFHRASMPLHSILDPFEPVINEQALGLRKCISNSWLA